MTSTEQINAVLDRLAEAQRTIDRPSLDRSITDLERLSHALAGHAPGQARVLANLGEALRQRFEMHGRRSDLETAIEVQDRALGLLRPGDPLRSFVLRGSSVLRQIRAERYGGPGTTEELTIAEDLAREAVLESGPTDPRWPVRLHTLAAAQRLRYQFGGPLEHLVDAAETARTASAAAPGDTVLASHLGLILRMRYEHHGRIADLHAAIDLGRPAAAGDDRIHAPMTWTNLSTMLEARHAHLGDGTDLADAVHAARRAVELTDPASLHHGMYLAVLARILALRGTDADRDEAVTTAQRAVTATPATAAQHQTRSALLARVLLDRGTIPDLHRATEVSRQAAAATLRTPHPDAQVLHTAAVVAGHGPAGQDEAIRYATRALALTGADDPVRASIEVSLGDWTAGRHPRTAATHYRAAAEQRTAAPSLRCDAARRWAAAARAAGDPAEALTAYRLAVGLLAIAASHGLRRGDRERHLADRTGLAGDAAATAVDGGAPDTAVQLLEQGRAVLHAQVLETRADFTTLQAAHPELAARASGLAALLDRVAVDDPSRRRPQAERLP
jgi:hypothetical protein